MSNTASGAFSGAGLRIGVVAARFNEVVTERLLRGTMRALREAGVREEDIEVVRVPGAFEVPLAADLMAGRGRFDAVVCLGAIVRGETQHHHYIAQAVFSALQHVQLARHIPVALGILTTENLEQALARSGDDPGNKGYEAARVALECALLHRQLG
ncbi:MAG: 6,7-dimethyl-8-ribityllumazine synthase [Candidatus Binatia bacterium]|nr:MAG: 6,7-dimethyl-8-ribityllumazine synthase [Candidatus Binatia bacterium]